MSTPGRGRDLGSPTSSYKFLRDSELRNAPNEQFRESERECRHFGGTKDFFHDDYFATEKYLGDFESDYFPSQKILLLTVSEDANPLNSMKLFGNFSNNGTH